MARLSKTAPFQIYSDNDPSKPNDSARNSVFDDGVKKQDNAEGQYEWTRKDDGFVTESDDERKTGQEDEAQQGDDEKNYTRTSISSLPESHYPTDQERTPMHKPYTPTYSRPSVRRMQMSSPLRKGKVGTPQSEPKGSPRTRRRAADFDLEEREPKSFPLVLLHITALPMNIPWSIHSMRETLPKYILDNIQLLRSKLSENVRRRGILIPHPREDYELLEEKLLEALELQEPRITKCGHFRSRHSISSSVTANSESSDSGMGSSVDGSDEEHCSTCHHHLRAAGSGKRKWSIKVFAANGLMRASAWSAAWSEMERVDVEIMPWINDSLRIKLDEMNLEELAVQRVDPEADERRINELVEERLRLIEEDTERAREAEMAREIERIVINEQRQQSSHSQEDAMVSIEPPKPTEPARPKEPSSTELPNIYRPKDIPLSILLRNYIFLLARKRWNMAVFIMMVTAVGLMLTSPSAITTRQAGLPTLAIPLSWGYGSSEDVVVSHQPVPQVPSLPEIAAHDNEAQESFEAVAEIGDSEPAPFPEASVVIDEDIAQAEAQEQVADRDVSSEPPKELELAAQADEAEEDTVATLPETRSEEVVEKCPVLMRSLQLATEQPTCGVAQQEAVFSEMPSLKIAESESLGRCLSFSSPLNINSQCSAADAREEF